MHFLGQTIQNQVAHTPTPALVAATGKWENKSQISIPLLTLQQLKGTGGAQLISPRLSPCP